MTLLDVQHVQKTYHTRFGGQAVQALKDIHFSIEAGEYVAIMGESGSGKTTLLNILALLDQPTKGLVYLNGQDTTTIKQADVAAFRRNELGFVFQDFNLLDTLSVKDNMILPLVLSNQPAKQMDSRVKPVANLLGIGDLLDKFPYELSGGQQQRVALARGLAVNPQVLFMDEPFAALDPITRHRLQDDLLRIVSERSKTVVFVTHDIHEAIYLADRVVVLSSSPGRVRRVLTIDSPRPRSRDSGAFARQYDLLYHELYSLSKQPIEYYI